VSIIVLTLGKADSIGCVNFSTVFITCVGKEEKVIGTMLFRLVPMYLVRHKINNTTRLPGGSSLPVDWYWYPGTRYQVAPGIRTRRRNNGCKT